MKICKYGISLTRLGSQDIDFVLQKLQNAENCPFAIKEEELTFDQKQDWFNSINNHQTIYFIVEFDGIKHGLMVVNNISWEARKCNIQHYYWDIDIKQSETPFLSSVALLEIGFYYLNWDSIVATIKPNDVDSKSRIQKFGFKPDAALSTTDEQKFSLASGDFYACFNTLLKEISIENKEKTGSGYLLLEPVDYESGIAGIIENNFLESGVYLHRRGISGSRMYFR